MLVGWYIEKLDGFHRVYYDMVPDPNQKYTYLIHDNTKEYKFNRLRMFEDKEREELKEIINEVLDEREKRYERDDDDWLYRGTY